MYQIFGTEHSAVNPLYNIFQERNRSFFFIDYQLPIPLVNIKRMQVVQFFISSDSIHVGINTIPLFYSVIGQSHSFPFGKRMYNFSNGIVHILNRKTHRTLYSIQVVVDSGSLFHKKRCGNTP
ncbi:hypothetical protein SDC9_155543 [bioreactor metagenome]|uniref:Uncharacterized protein n=1 Tax=bioreactor metagenome TaxID=1076179 RepID=A0A645F1V4_9ZZZZ